MNIHQIPVKNSPISPLTRYANAVRTLLPLAKGSSSGAHAATVVLLACDNYGGLQLDVSELRVLDDGYRRAAIAVINGYAELNRSASSTIDNGSEIFQALYQDWFGN